MGKLSESLILRLREETNPFYLTPKNFVGVEMSDARDNINTLLNGVTSQNFVTPYNALERVRKVLANYHIFIPHYTFMEGDEGVSIFPIDQFGIKSGMNNSGQFINKGEMEKDQTHGPHMGGENFGAKEEGSSETIEAPAPEKYSVYFEYQATDNGMFEVFCEVVTEDELDEIMEDMEEDEEGESEELDENYHPSYSSAIQTAVAAAAKRGYKVDEDDYHNKVSSGPRKPSEGKTVSHNIKLTKDGKPTKKGLAIQVYNRGGDKTPYELNHYISEEEMNEENKSMKPPFEGPYIKMEPSMEPPSVKATFRRAKKLARKAMEKYKKKKK